MVAQTQRAWGRIVVQALAAGIVAGALNLGFLWLAFFWPVGANFWIASANIAVQAVGIKIVENPNAPQLGLGIQAVVSIVWAGAYAYLASTKTFLNARWPISGIAYGAIVYLVMQLVLLVSGRFLYPHSPNDFVLALIANAVFFGLPVAYVVKLMDRP